MALVGVVADDLTGANDTAVQFSKQGFRAVVLLGLGSISTQGLDADVVVVDTASRDSPPDSAAHAARAATAALRASGVALLYKKLDSTLRGNVATEIQAVVDAFDSPACLVAPAFPALQRVTLGGYQLAGMGLAAEAPESPLLAAERSHVPALLEATLGPCVAHLPLIAVRQPGDRLARSMREHAASGRRLLVADALDDHDLLSAARAFRAARIGAVIAGSGGLAAAVPSVWSMRGGAQPQTEEEPVVVLAGSLNRVTRRQLASLSALSNPPAWIEMAVPALADPAERPREWERQASELLVHVLSGSDVVVTTSPPADGETPHLDASGLALRSVITATFGMLARKAAEADPSVGLVVTGGDVAEAVLRELDVEGMAIEEEVLPGIPFGRCVAGPFDGLRVISKAGGFGADAALADCMRYLKEEARHHERHLA